MKHSPFSYNESVAQEYFPLTRQQVENMQLRWNDQITNSSYQGPHYYVPAQIEDVPDDILDRILVCEVTGRSYKIIKQELDFYRRMNLPIPLRCPDQRHADRMRLRNPRQLWDRDCSECSAFIKTTYAPDRREQVVCEECYLKLVV